MRQNKRVLFLLRNHFNPDIRVEKEARSLARTGYEVEVRCLWDTGLERDEKRDGFTIRRLTYVSRTNRHIAYKMSRLFLFSFQATRDTRKFDIIHCNDLDMLPLGIWIKALAFGGKKVVYDAHEYETERDGMSSFFKKFTGWVESFLIRFADAVLTVSASIAKEYNRLYNIDPPTVLLNCPPYQPLIKKNIFRETFPITEEQIVFLYQGGMSPHRGIEIILEAFKNLEHPDKVIVFMGFGPLVSMVQSAAQNHKNIFYHPSVSTDVLHNYTASADIGILFYENTCLNHFYCFPNKLFEYTMAGLPVITSNLYELSQFIERHQNGVVAPGNDIDSLTRIIESLDWTAIKEMKQKAASLGQLYNWEKQEELLLQVYSNL